MLTVLTLKEAPKKVIDLLHSGEQFGEYDTIHYCLYYGWLDLFERQNGTYYVGTRISNSAESMDMLLERLSKATYGSDAVFYQCIEKGYLELDYDVEMYWVTKELEFEPIKENAEQKKSLKLPSIS